MSEQNQTKAKPTPEQVIGSILGMSAEQVTNRLAEFPEDVRKNIPKNAVFVPPPRDEINKLFTRAAVKVDRERAREAAEKKAVIATGPTPEDDLIVGDDANPIVADAVADSDGC